MSDEQQWHLVVRVGTEIFKVHRILESRIGQVGQASCLTDEEMLLGEFQELEFRLYLHVNLQTIVAYLLGQNKAEWI